MMERVGGWLAAVVVSFALVGCPEDEPPGSTGPTCPAGEENCACRDDGSCDAGLACTDGFCVAAAACPEGAEGCACYANGTCDAKDGVAMTCNAANVCEAAAACTPGSLDCACGPGDSCDSGLLCQGGTCVTDSGCTAGTLNCTCGSGDTCDSGLLCQGGTCVTDPGCTAGTLNCACGAGDTCDSGLVCDAGTCVTDPGCTAGTLGCACGAGDTCGSGLACQGGTCVTDIAPGTGLKVTDSSVRACGLVLELADATVTFGAAVVGRTKRQGSRLAISFTAKADEALPDGFATILDGAGQVADVSAVTPETIQCFDRQGAAVAAPGLTLQ
jgi:hypothetical protein